MSEKHALQVALETARQEGLEIRIRNYSGRGMFGAQCLAVTFDRGVSETEIAAEAMASAGYNQMAVVRSALKGSRTDSMGLGTVLYWPNVGYVESELEDND